MNLSIIEFELFQGLVVNSTIRIVHGIIFPVGMIISTFFYWGTIYYERYGGDPMKRTIENKLVSAISFSIIVICYSANVGLAWRIQIGPLNDNVAMANFGNPVGNVFGILDNGLGSNLILFFAFFGRVRSCFWPG